MYQLPDVRTLFIIWFIVCAVLSLDLTLFWLNNRNEKGTAFWALAMVVTTIGAILFIFRGFLPAFLSVTIANTLAVLGWSFISKGLRDFFNIEKGALWEVIPVPALVLGFSYYLYVEPSLLARILIISVIFSVQMLRSFYLLAKQSSLDTSVKSISAQYSTLILGVFFLSRTILTLFNIGTPDTQSFLSPNLVTVIMMILLITVYVSLTVGLITLPGRKSRHNLQKATEELEKINFELQNSNQALALSNARFQSFYNASHEGILFIEKGIILDNNRKAEEILGYGSGEVIGKQAIDLVSPDQKNSVQEKIATQYSAPYKTILRHKENRDVYVEVHGNYFEHEGRNIRIAAVRDLTEQMEVEAEIKNLQGIIPICSYCKGIRDDQGAWKRLEVYIEEHSDALFSHGICTTCLQEHYPKTFKELQEEDQNK